MTVHARRAFESTVIAWAVADCDEPLILDRSRRRYKRRKRLPKTVRRLCRA